MLRLLPATASCPIMLSQSHLPEPNHHVFDFLHPSLLCRIIERPPPEMLYCKCMPSLFSKFVQWLLLANFFKKLLQQFCEDLNFLNDHVINNFYNIWNPSNSVAWQTKATISNNKGKENKKGFLCFPHLFKICAYYIYQLVKYWLLR